MNDFKTPDRIKCRSKPGYITLDVKWKNTDLYVEIKGLFNGVHIDNLKDFDFCLPEMNFVYLSEVKLTSGVDVQHLLSLRGTTFIADRNVLTVEIYDQLQGSFIPLGINLLPIGHKGELPLLLHQLYLADVVNTPGSNFQPSSKPTANVGLQLLLSVPSLGQSKAAKLLDKLGTVQKVFSASVKDLVPIVGVAAASQIYNFVHSEV